MNKQKYLAELQRLLVFMTEEDRALTVRRYGEIFDAAGPEGEADVVASLGTPTKAAIDLSRGYEPGMARERLPSVPAPAPEPETPAPEEKPRELWEELPDFEPPETPSPRRRPAPPAPGLQTAAAAVTRLTDESMADGEAEWPDLPARSMPTVVYERSVPLGLGIPLFILLTLALGVPLLLLCAALTAVFLAPGCAVLLGAYLLFVGGLWCLSIVADAILLFGAALVVLAIGLFVLRIGLWLTVRIWTLWGKALIWVARELLGRRVTEDA